ncbi:MAG: SpoIIE family protein phosphatase [Bacteroidota bacterium]|nr:SpoIIE family protein phosphatase [Bacteroidota bacterium]
MLSISTIPFLFPQGLYKPRVGSKRTFRSFLRNTYKSLTDLNAEKKQQCGEADFFSQLDRLNLSTLVTVFDANSNIVHANAMFCKASGYSLNELLLKKYFFLHHPDTPGSVLENIRAAIAMGDSWQGELKNLSKQGTVYWTFVTINPVKDNTGKPVKYISTLQDITRQKQLEVELRQVKRKIDHELEGNLEYAKSMHSAFLNDTKDIKTISNEAFLLYKEKKVISGDFYKIEERDNKLVFIIGDSTGHGISASYISILALNSINRILKLSSLDPSDLLSEVNDELYQATRAEGKRKLLESADMMACCLDIENRQLSYASANMRGFIIRRGELIILEKDKCSIGEVNRAELKVSNRTINLEKGDCLYVFSDGLIDQFGGPNDKRMGMKKIIALAKEVNSYPMAIQKKVIEVTLSQWQSEYEQTDDMTMFGIRI